MVQFSFKAKVITAKIVYYGPALSGKTTNLVALHSATDPEGRTRLVSLNTAEDRTLFFDLLPLDLGRISGFSLRLQVFTVPGQPRYHWTRKAVLAGADGVVFVADSRSSHLRENLAALEDMRSNLAANRLAPERIPLVFQFNKQDLPDLQPEADLKLALGTRGRCCFPAVATRGEGVLETFAAAAQQVLVAIAEAHNLRGRGLDPARVPELVKAALDRLCGTPLPATSEWRGSHLVFAAEPAAGAPAMQTGDDPLLASRLLVSAIETNAGMAQTLTTLLEDAGALANGILERDQGLPEEARWRSLREGAARLRERIAGLPTAPPASPAPAAADSGTRPLSVLAMRHAAVAPLLRSACNDAEGALVARQVKVVLEVPEDLRVDLRSPERLQRAVAAYLEALADASPAGSTAVVRGSRQSVSTPAQDGRSLARPFLVVTLAHRPVFSEPEEKAIVRGGVNGSLGESRRLVRELGGYLQISAPNAAARETLMLFPVALT